MQKYVLRDLAVWAVLVISCVALRLSLSDVPNFAPVAGLSLFAGFFFRNRLWAASAPLVVMTVADRSLGGYHPVVMFAVYAGLVLPVFFGAPIRQRFAKAARWPQRATAVGGLFGYALFGSVIFFLVSNFACWTIGMYSMTWSGLTECYWQALPFFRYTLMGDISFAAAFFAAYYLVHAMQPAASTDFGGASLESA